MQKSPYTIKIQKKYKKCFFLDIREAGSSSSEEVKLPLALSLSPPKTKHKKTR
jgi:hypothetical protein